MSKRERTCDWCKWYIPEVCTRFPKWTDVIFSHKHFCGEHEWNSKAKEEIAKEFKDIINE